MVVGEVVVEFGEDGSQVLPLGAAALQVGQIGAAVKRRDRTRAGRGRHVAGENGGKRPLLLLGVQGQENEGLVPGDRSPNCASELVSRIQTRRNGGFRIGRHRGVGDEGVGLEKPVGRPVPIVGARLGHHVDQASGGVPELRRESRVANLELLNRVLRHGEVLGFQRAEPFAEERVPVVHSIDDQSRVLSGLTLEPHGRAQPGSGVGRRRQIGEIPEVTSADGQVLHVFVVDRGIHPGLALVHAAGSTLHGDFLTDRLELEGDVLHQLLAHREHHAFHDHCGETGQGDFDHVFSGRQNVGSKPSRLVADQHPFGARRGVDHRHVGSRDHGAGGVEDGAADGAFFQGLARKDSGTVGQGHR